VKHILSAIALAFVVTPASAEGHLGSGDSEAGAAVFKKCQSCHVVRDDEGTTLAGKSGKIGPNLFGVVGRTAGALEGFRYKKSIIAAGEGGLVWDAEQIAEYVQDPTKFLRKVLDSGRARSGMSFKLRDETDAANIAAFLATFSDPSS
jgi:cytochrome c